MKIKIKDENKTIGFALCGSFCTLKKGIPTRVSARDMRKIFRMLRRARRKGKHILELEVGDDVKIVI